MLLLPRIISNSTRLAKAMMSHQHHNAFLMQSTRLCASKADHEQIKQESEFKPVYMFPYINAARLICRLKLYQTGLIVSVAGVSIVTETNVDLILATSSLALVMLGVMGEIFRKLIGIIYVDPATERVKISHLNFFGNRIDRIVKLQDIVAVSDTDEVSNDVLVKLKFYEKTLSPLYLNIRHGKIIDETLFKHVVLGSAED